VYLNIKRDNLKRLLTRIKRKKIEITEFYEHKKEIAGMRASK